jgi:DNA-binding MarR family transcriptional regulator
MPVWRHEETPFVYTMGNSGEEGGLSTSRRRKEEEGAELLAAGQGYGRFWSTFNQAYWVVIRVAEAELRALDLTMIQAAVLYWVKTSKEPPTPADLSRLLFRRPHTVSDLLNRMEKQGLVRRKRDAKRKNVSRILLTDKGEEAFKRQREVGAVARILSELTPEESEILLAALDKLRQKAIEELKSGLSAPYGWQGRDTDSVQGNG